MSFDLLVTNGLVIDGTGLPRRRADVAVRDGRIVGVGRFDASEADRVLDAKGRIVAPGLVDPHTHYDPQLTFEPYGTSSCFHGVTTVLLGNCGVTFAPVSAKNRRYMAELMEAVEDIAADAIMDLCSSSQVRTCAARDRATDLKWASICPLNPSRAVP